MINSYEYHAESASSALRAADREGAAPSASHFAAVAQAHIAMAGLILNKSIHDGTLKMQESTAALLANTQKQLDSLS